jgi:uncharacterized protein YndB with AHSA1/START domain
LIGPAIARTFTGMIDLTFEIPASIEKTWICLTGPAHLRHWWNNVTLDAIPGGHFEEKQGDARGNVLGVKTKEELRLSWAGPDWPIATEITIRLSGGAGNTRVALSHGGWSAFPEGDRDHLIETHRQGWTRRLESLAAYAAHGMN